MESLQALFDSEALLHPISPTTPSLVDLIRVLSYRCGVRQFPVGQGVATLNEDLPATDHFVFVIVDGLGASLLDRLNPSGFLKRSFRRELRTIYPSTTAAALTTLSTGQWPSVHGINGFFMYFPSVRRIISPLLFREYQTEMTGESLGLDIRDLIPTEPLFGTYFRDTTSLIPKKLVNQAYARWSRRGTELIGYRNLSQALRRTRRVVKHAPAATFTYIYFPEVDTVSHRLGPAHEGVTAAIGRIDAFLGRLRDSLPPTTSIVVTADHGQVTIGHKITVDETWPLMTHLIAPPTGESMNPVFFVRDGHEAAFRRRFIDEGLAEHFSLFAPDQVEEMQLLGPEPLAPNARENLGSFVAVAEHPVQLEYLPKGSESRNHVGAHGGLRPDEMRIPLFIG